MSPSRVSRPGAPLGPGAELAQTEPFREPPWCSFPLAPGEARPPGDCGLGGIGALQPAGVRQAAGRSREACPRKGRRSTAGTGQHCFLLSNFTENKQLCAVSTKTPLSDDHASDRSSRQGAAHVLSDPGWRRRAEEACRTGWGLPGAWSGGRPALHARPSSKQTGLVLIMQSEEEGALIVLISQVRKLTTERFRDLHRVTQLARGRAAPRTQAAWLQGVCPSGLRSVTFMFLWLFDFLK